jgi:UDP-N-acetylmuramate--alanine ligase
MSLYPTRIAVAGMHGKSTVTAMLAAILREAGRDPAVISGAPLSVEEESFRLGGKEIVLVEACEYKDSFLCLSPTVAVVLNAEEEHPDYFHNGQEVCRSFTAFLQGAEIAILPAARQAVALLPDPRSCVLRFGCETGANDTAASVTYEQGNAAFDYISNGIKQGRVKLKVPGEHNLQNALAAACAARACGVDSAVICEALSEFYGTPCRLQARGVWNGVNLYEDYAHHPTEIRASLAALRRMTGEKGRLLCLFQAHTYSRTAAFFCDFAAALSAADVAVLTDIYAAREKNESGVSAAALAAAVRNGIYEADATAAFDRLLSLAREGDTLVVMGAGDVRRVFEKLEKIEKEPRG